MTLDTKIDECPSQVTMKSNSMADNKPPSVNSQEDQDLCPICCSASISSCRNCKKISYCSKAHQRLHWKVHKEECFPLIHQYEQILGSRLIATRNIKLGEIILREKPLLSGPKVVLSPNPPLTCVNGESTQLCEEKAKSSKPICLGCCKVVKSDYLCPSCSWPACGPTCVGEGSDHGELECKIFTQHPHETTVKEHLAHVSSISSCSSSSSGFKYVAVITVLRALLFKERDPIRWKKMLKLDEMWNGKECDNSQEWCAEYTDFGQFCHEFIMSLCLCNVTNQDIQLVLRVICYRHFSIYDDGFQDLEQRDMQASHLFYTASQATKNCVPNSSWVIHPDTNEIHLRALVPIQFGRTVTLSYANVTQDVIDRQTNPAFTTLLCECERCKDPTELGTFYSSIKCQCQQQQQNETTSENATTSTSWLLPTTVQRKVKENGKKIKELMWKCQECEVTKSLDFYKQVVATVNAQVCDAFKCAQFQGESFADAAGLIENLEMLCNKHANITVHPNHFTIFTIELNILRIMSQKLSTFAGAVGLCPATAERFTSLCRKWLEVADVLWPGLSRQRGELLYYYQQALALELILSISRRMRRDPAEEEFGSEDLIKIEKSVMEKQFLKILNIRKVVLQIFCFDPSNTMGGRYAQNMVERCSEIEILKRYVFLK